MEELGIIIAPNGEYTKFGKWLPRIERNEEDNHVYMTGPATVVFDGEIEL